jgi:ABC-2 type transport system permease protein
LFWFLIGSGLGESFRSPTAPGREGLSYLQYFFPGTILLMVLFTAVFSAFSVIEDRKEGFLQAVLVTPSPRSALVMGKLLGGAALSMLQAALMMCLAPLLHISLSHAVQAAAVLFFVSIGMTGLGFLGAWMFDSMQGFHSVMSLVLMPMWFLSGALFPVDGAPAWLAVPMKINPLTHSLDLLQHLFFPSTGTGVPGIVSILVTILFPVAVFAACLHLTSDGRR